MTVYSKEMLAAFETTIQVYEQAILDLDCNEAPIGIVAAKWRHYGSRHSCRLCKVISYGGDNGFCKGCVLENFPEDSEDGNQSCETDDSGVNELHEVLKSINDKNIPNEGKESKRPALLKALRFRHKWLLNRAEENGIVMCGT